MKIKNIIGPIALSVAASIWGGMFVVVKIVVKYIPPIELVWSRYLIAIIVLILFSLIRREKWHINKRDLVLVVLIGLIGNTISIVAQETGTWLSNAQTGAVITSATPTFMLIFAWVLLKERLNKFKIIAVLMATAGVIAIVGVHISGKHIFKGILLLVVAALTWALMSVLIKKVKTYSSLQITIIATLVAIICLTPFVIANPNSMATINLTNPIILLSLLYLGIVSTAFAFILWNYGLTLVSASNSGLFFLWQPIVGTILGWLFLNESLTWGFLIGSLLILLSVWLTIRFDN
ncbi:DMT family transporter [Lentilactobacillus sp. SPB1-3]|uniref:DMT family transporter n=1 Tax=Lentilactobacillus terminaliae TaxID=3003483 RepID=A0ACD5DFL1_9LACO|nr:DMT family transporter [Lentilactobacillus sp. SPB1-3]MCZ0976595.1 DMT family transporter [Lentilactobacillus sp. SPB1-3]